MEIKLNVKKIIAVIDAVIGLSCCGAPAYPLL